MIDRSSSETRREMFLVIADVVCDDSTMRLVRLVSSVLCKQPIHAGAIDRLTKTTSRITPLPA